MRPLRFSSDSPLTPGVLSVVGLGLAVYLAYISNVPPSVVPSEAPQTVFSAERALLHLRVIARDPHPIGSPANAAVRAYLVDRLRAHGLRPEVQEATGLQVGWKSAGRVHNVMARVPGTASTGAILLMAHYDSVPQSYGASDDGAGVAAILETLQALLASPPLRNDVIVLFTDGEEAGLLGATAFVRDHPWAADVGLVMNFEGRGHRGVVSMFETSEQNGALIAAFGRAAPHPVASSLSYEIYRRMPNDTDLSVFKEADRYYSALNFAYIGGLTHYHTALDNIRTIDPRSLQHHGDYMLALTRSLGERDLAELVPQEDRVYFTLPLLGMVRYPIFVAKGLAVLGAIGWAVVLGLGIRRRAVRGGGVARGFLALVFALVAGPGLTYVLWQGIDFVHPGYDWILQGTTYNHELYALGFGALTVAATLAVYLFALRTARAFDLLVAPLLGYAVLSVLAAWQVPGASFIVTWPLLFGLGAAALLVDIDRRESGLLRVLGLTLLAVPPVVLIGQLLGPLAANFGSAILPGAMVLLVLLLVLLIPQMETLAFRRWGALPSLFAGVAAGCLLWASLTAGFDEARKKPNSMLYALDADSQEAVWASLDPEADTWTAQFLGDEPRRAPLDAFRIWGVQPVLQSPAPVLDAAPPAVEVIADSLTDGGRYLHLRLRSPRGAPVLGVYLDGHVPLASVQVDGEPLHGRPANPLDDALYGPAGSPPAEAAFQPAGGGRIVTYYAVPARGIDLSFFTEATDPLPLVLIDLSYGLPDFQEPSIQSRPDDMMMKPFVVNNAVVVRRRIEV